MKRQLAGAYKDEQLSHICWVLRVFFPEIVSVVGYRCS